MDGWQELAAFHRPMLDILEEALGESVPKIIRQLENGESAAVYQRLVDKLDEFPDLKEALDAGEMTIIVSKCESGNAKMPVITMDPVVIRDRFMKAVSA